MLEDGFGRSVSVVYAPAVGSGETESFFSGGHLGRWYGFDGGVERAVEPGDVRVFQPAVPYRRRGGEEQGGRGEGGEAKE